MGLPMNTDGYVALALLLRHPAFVIDTVKDIYDLVGLIQSNDIRL